MFPGMSPGNSIEDVFGSSCNVRITDGLNESLFASSLSNERTKFEKFLQILYFMIASILKSL